MVKLFVDHEVNFFQIVNDLYCHSCFMQIVGSHSHANLAELSNTIDFAVMDSGPHFIQGSHYLPHPKDSPHLLALLLTRPP